MIIRPESILIYDNIKKAKDPVYPDLTRIKMTFDYFPKITIESGNPYEEPYNISFFSEDGSLLYGTTIPIGYFSMAYRKWIENFKGEVKNNKGEVIESFRFYDKLKSEDIVIAIESDSLGDTIAWIPYIIKFVETHECSNVTITTFWNSLFEEQYKNVKFMHPGYRSRNTSIVIGIGWYDEMDRSIHKEDPRSIPLQKVASDILGIEYIGDVRAKIKGIKLTRPTKNKYVCIATESTAAAKHWNREGGWQTLVNLLKDSGYDIVVIHKQRNNLKNVIDKTGNIDISERVSDLLQCDFYIGVGSGLSWLSWSLGIPTVLISGFSHKFCEFRDKTLRIINTKVCHGCFNNPNYKFDKGDWNWCPVNKGTGDQFICTRSISPEYVFQSIKNWEFYTPLK